ncbi:MAG: efflux RND transporter permease subunit [bacterium]
MNVNEDKPIWQRGALAYMAGNSVAANLLMLVFVIGGLMLASRIKQEVFPEVDLDTVSIQVVYPGAGPEEVEQGVVLAIEEAVRGVDGVKKVRSTAREGVGIINTEVLTGADSTEVLNDIKSAVDRITSIPRDAERPVISLLSNRQQVISLVIYGDKTERELRALGDEVRDELLGDKRITVVELGGVRPPEISIEVPQENLRRYNMSLAQVANAVGQASVELPGGGVKTSGGEVLLRTTERREKGFQFEDITVLANPDGTAVKVGDLANVVDGFQEIDREATFNGQRAVRVDVFRIGDQTPINVADAVKEYVERKTPELPNGVSMAVWNDQSEVFKDRLNLLLKNAYFGVALVLLVLGLFLEIRLAFWVTSGIAISVLGAMLFMPAMDVSINMISLFGFILTLGIVVDDAIVAGEAIYHHRQEGMPALEASIKGIQEVAGPVIFSVLTTIVAFTPLLFVPGIMGKFFKNIPMIVIPILAVSLIEALFILPAHLAHAKDTEPTGLFGYVHRAQQRFSQGVERFIYNTYQPIAETSFVTGT